MRDLAGGQTADRPQRERDRRGRCERRVTAHEHEDQRVVAARRGLDVRIGARDRPGRREVFAAAAGVVPPVLVDHAPRGNPDEPGEGVVGLPVGRPGVRGGDERFLGRVLRVGEVAVAPDHRPEHLRRELAQQVLGVRGAHISGSGAPNTWRTSIGCWIGTPFGPGAAEACAAIRARGRASRRR